MRLAFFLLFFYGFIWSTQAQDSIILDFAKITSGFDNAESIYLTSSGNLYVTETGRNRILKISSDGIRLDSLGRLGSGDYQFDRPVDIDATNELMIYVADYNNRRIQIYDRRFQFLSTVDLPRRILRDISYSPLKLQVNNRGQLFFYDEERQYIYKFNSSGQYEQHFDTRGVDRINTPSDMVSLGDDLYLADSRQNVIHRLSSNGSYHGFFATPSPPVALTVQRDQIWVIAGNNILRYSSRRQLINKYSLNSLPKIKDIAISRNRAYLLTGEGIFMADID